MCWHVGLTEEMVTLRGRRTTQAGEQSLGRVDITAGMNIKVKVKVRSKVRLYYSAL